jgi:hypothetical protein
VTHHEHRLRHAALFDFLDELVSDCFAQTDFTPETSIAELVQWASQQAVNPTRNRFEHIAPSHLPVVKVDRG